jgi:hypothetical protein
MTLRALCYLVVLVPTLCARGESVPDGYAIMPQLAGPDLMRQCSRFAPTHISTFWTPSVLQVQAIEQRLIKLLRRSGHHINLVDSRRQYIGVITRGKKLIYLNAFPASALDPPDHIDWRRTAFTACDGGDVFWGVEFDPATNSFANLEFNGDA